MLALSQSNNYYGNMLGLLIAPILFLSFYYVSVNKVLISQLDSLKDFYANVEQITDNAINQNNLSPPAPIEKLGHPLTRN